VQHSLVAARCDRSISLRASLVGYFNETATDELSKDGNSYTGTNETKLYDLSGNMPADVTGTASAKRILP
jgi:hypothetical protein